MRNLLLFPLAAIALLVASGSWSAQSLFSNAPYRVLKRANVGGEGDWDYIYADAEGRRLYIPREVESKGPAPAGSAGTRLTIFDLDTLQPVGAISGVGGSGTVVDPKWGHGFTSSNPVSMFDTRTMKLIKTIDVAQGVDPDGIYFDKSNDRVYVFSHPTHDATVIDAKNGAVLGRIDLGGRPEQAAADGKGTLYVVLQEEAGRVAKVDENAMKTTAHFPLGDAGGCNGLALDAAHEVLFAACARSGQRPSKLKNPYEPINPVFVVLSAKDGKILAKEPLVGSSDGAAFNPETMEAFSTDGQGSLTVLKEISPLRFQVEQNLKTMDGARTITLDGKTGRIFTMADRRSEGAGGTEEREHVVPGSFTILEIGR